MAEEDTTRARPDPRKLSDQEKLRIIQDTICQQFQKTDRILLGQPGMRVSRSDSPTKPPGWTNGREIKLNFAWLNVRTDLDLVALKGLNYHELGHVIMTPRIRGDLAKTFREFYQEDTLNQLEDWRIETQFSLMFSAAERYFSVCARRLLLDDHELRDRKPEDDWKNFIAVLGRLYLPPPLRLHFELKFREYMAQSGQSRREEIVYSAAMGIQNRDLPDKMEEHLVQLTKDWDDPGVVGRTMALFDLKGDARVDAIIDVGMKYVTRRWVEADKPYNRETILMVKKMAILLPWEVLRMDPVAGMPLPDNQAQGGLMGVDTPTRSHMSNEHMHDMGEEAAKEKVEEDQKEMDELRRAARAPRNEEQPEDEDENELAAPGPTDPDEDEEDLDLDDPEDDGDLDEEYDLEDDEDEEFEDDLPDESSTGGDADGNPKPNYSEQILIDPRQSRSQDTDDEEDEDEDGSDEEMTDPEQFGGHLTAGAGQGEWGDRGSAQMVRQLTEEELKWIDESFHDAGILDQLLTDEVEAIIAQPEMRNDLRNVRQAISEALGENLDLDPSLDTEYKQVSPRIMKARDELRELLDELRGLLEGTWRDEQPAGKVNLRRLFNAPPAQRGSIYRAWIKDEVEEAGLEMVILLDRSSSMASAMDHASQICWMVGSAVQETEGRVHVISFADRDKQEVLLSPAKKLRNAQYQAFGSYGATHAEEALKLALQVMQRSQMPNRMVAIITDGTWHDLEESVRVIKKINNLDCDTVLMLMGLHLERESRGCRHNIHVNDLNRASVELRNMVKRMEMDVVRRVSMSRGFYND